MSSNNYISYYYNNSNHQHKNHVNVILDKVKYLTKVNIMVIGQFNSGKTVLINELQSYVIQEPNYYLNFIEFPGYQLSQEQQKKVNEDIYKEVDKNEDINKMVHCIFYCINSRICKVSDYEFKLLDDLHNYIKERNRNIPIIIVLTQTLQTDKVEILKKYIENNLDFVTVIPVRAESIMLRKKIKLRAFGIDHLYKMVVEKFPYEIGLNPLENNDSSINIDEDNNETCDFSELRGQNKFILLITIITLFNIFGIFIIPFPFQYYLIAILSQLIMILAIVFLSNIEFHDDLKMIIFSVLDLFSVSIILWSIFLLIHQFGFTTFKAISVIIETAISLLLGFIYAKAMYMIQKKEMSDDLLYSYRDRLSILHLLVNDLKNKQNHYEMLL